MRIAYIAAGAGGMYCGSCIHDNTLAATLMRQGHEVALLPTYTPIRTDEEGVSGPRVFYGALNVYLEQKSALFRHTPRALAWLLDRPWLLKQVAKLGSSTDARDLGRLALGVLEGEAGPQAAELEKLVSWLRDRYRPEVVQITNSMFLGLVRRLKQELEVPVVVALQGEDLFIEQLHEPYRQAVIDEMRRRAVEVDLFIAPSRYYAGYMGELLDLPPEKTRVVPLGVRLEGHRPRGDGAGARPTLGYLARICPEKGLHLLVDAFVRLASRPENATLRLRIAGYLGGRDKEYLKECLRTLEGAGLSDRVDCLGEVDLAGKMDFLHSLDILSVPTTYREPKGLFVLEAMASGLPVVQPAHGSFPEMIEATGGGLLVEPDSPDALAGGIQRLIDDPELRRSLGRSGRSAVTERFNDEEMARATAAVYREVLT